MSQLDHAQVEDILTGTVSVSSALCSGRLLLAPSRLRYSTPNLIEEAHMVFRKRQISYKSKQHLVDMEKGALGSTRFLQV
jgi:hypothetical protein